MKSNLKFAYSLLVISFSSIAVAQNSAAVGKILAKVKTKGSIMFLEVISQ